MLNASYLYAGYSDYFSGYGCADDADHSEHLLYAHYGRGSTLRSIIDQLVEDSWNGPGGETLPDDITQDVVRAALLDMLSSNGRADYDSGAIAECSAAIEAFDECPNCDESLNDDDYEDCPHCGASLDDYSESPVFIVYLEYVKESGQGEW